MNYFNNKRINALINKELSCILEEYGDIKYAYAIMNKKNPIDMIIINNHPTWFDIYIESNYQLIDPVIIKSLDRVEDFSWDEKIRILSELTLPKIFNAGKKHNIVAGHTFVLHDNKHNLAVLSILEGDSGDAALKNCIKNNREKLQSLLTSIHQKMLSLYQKMEGYSHNKIVMLSPRENEVLYWASSGKTYQEIAIILGIKLSTVKFHIGKVVKKLGVSNAKHAIKLAVELQIIRQVSLIDNS